MKRLFTLMLVMLMVLSVKAEEQDSPNILSADIVELKAVGSEYVEYNLANAIEQLNRAHSGLGLSLTNFRNLKLVKDVGDISYNNTSYLRSINFGGSTNCYGFILSNTDSVEEESYPTGLGTYAFLKHTAYNTGSANSNPTTHYTSIKLCYYGQGVDTSDMIYVVIETDFSEGGVNYKLISIPFQMTTKTTFNAKNCPTQFFNAAQGQDVELTMNSILEAEGHVMYSFKRAMIVADWRQIGFGSEGIYGTSSEDESSYDTKNVQVCYNNIQGVTLDETDEKWTVTYNGSTITEDRTYYFVTKASAANKVMGYDLEVYPLRFVTYNSFRYLDYPLATNSELDRFISTNSEREGLFMAKNAGTQANPDYKIVGSDIKLPETMDSPRGNTEKPVSVFSVFKNEKLTNALSLPLVKLDGKYYLGINSDDGASIQKIVIFDTSQGAGSDYQMSFRDPEDAGEYENYVPLQVVPLSDGSYAVRATMPKNQNQTAYIYLDYNSTSGNIDLLYSETLDDEAHKLLLYHEVLREDNTPHFQLYNKQVTSINGGQDGDFKDAVDPLVIEMTFDRPVKTVGENFTGEVLDLDNIPLSRSEKLKIVLTLEDGTVIEYGGENSDNAPARTNGPKKARPVMISSTHVKPSYNNVVVMELDENQFSSLIAEAPSRNTGPKKARPVMISSTNVKVIAKAGAIAYDDAGLLAPAPRRAASQNQSSRSLSDEIATTAFAFEYDILANTTAGQEKDKILSGNRVNINAGPDGIATYYAKRDSAIVAGSTDQLKFYRVSALSEGQVTLTRIKGIAFGPMIVQGKPNRPVTVDKESGTENNGANFLRYCLKKDVDCDERSQYDYSDYDYIPYYYGYTINFGNEAEPSDYPTETVQAHNYLFGRMNNGPLGFYHLDIREPEQGSNSPGWKNPYNRNIVYLHSYKDITPQASAGATRNVKLVLEDGNDITEQTTGIFLITNETKRQYSCRNYNTMGQAVSPTYKGIVIRDGKKSINK